MVDWQPGTTQYHLQARARLLADIRQFFAARHVLEVDTPLLAGTTATDVYIQSFPVSTSGSKLPASCYLQTSPEFAMKRLLAAGSGAIYQMCKAFRAEEPTRIHNPEFTILEWYRPGFSLTDLMDEVEQLVTEVVQCGAIERISYRRLFMDSLEIDPHTITLKALKTIAHDRIRFGDVQLTATDYLQQLLAQVIEPTLPDFCFIHDYPVAQAALAALGHDAQGQQVAQRFELFGKGLEIANGYFELTDAEEQRCRFAQDNDRRKQLNLPQYPIDEKLLAALESGMPACAGVALGVDRLLMLQTGATEINQVISFTTT